MLDVGSTVPALRSFDHLGRPVDLDELTRVGPVVVYFYPRVFTPGCTAEACGFRDAHEALAGANVDVIGISPDPVDRQRAFAARHALPFRLVSDPGRNIAREWDALGFFALGVARVTYIVGPSRELLVAVRDEIRVGRHVREVLTRLALAESEPGYLRADRYPAFALAARAPRGSR